jgi:transcriptional regulator
MESKLYIPSHFKEDDRAHINEILTQYPFATLILTQNNIPHVVHLPVLFDSEMHCLRGHIARSNEISRLDLNVPYNCLVIFQGPDAYISPS